MYLWRGGDLGRFREARDVATKSSRHSRGHCWMGLIGNKGALVEVNRKPDGGGKGVKGQL
jgi:hypothetical protein